MLEIILLLLRSCIVLVGAIVLIFEVKAARDLKRSLKGLDARF